jgi:putative transposase
VRRAFKFRLFTNANQERELGIALETQRRLYNVCLEQRKTAYETDGSTVRYTEQSAWFKAERMTNPFFARLNFSSAQATMRRLEKSFANFFRRVKIGGEKPGYPRFKGRDFFNSIEYPSHGDGIRLTGNRLRVQHVGVIRVKLHRVTEGTIKILSIKREAGKWYLVVSCDLGEVKVEPSKNPAAGIDVGLTSFLTASDGTTEPNPRYLKAALPELRRKQRSLSRKKKGGKNRRKARKMVAKVHARVGNLRREHHHQASLKLVRRYGVIVVERLSIKNMLKNDRLARAISDVAWGNFLLTLRSKAESAGVAFVEVDARGTSQECPGCARVVPKDLSQRWHSCECGCSLERDEASARVILARGLQARTGPAERNVADRRTRAPRSRRLQATE